MGWYKDAACEKAWAFDKDKVTEDMTLYASWIRGARPGTTKLSSRLYTGRKKILLKWPAAKGASDYRIAVRKAGTTGWKWYWANGRLSYTMKGLSKKNFYEFKIKAAAEAGNSYIYGKESPIVYRYINNISGLKIRSVKGGKKAKISWKKDKKATGYQIRYAGNKALKNPVKINLSSKRTSWTITKPKKNAACYFRIRSIVKKQGKTYYGAYSPLRKIR